MLANQNLLYSVSNNTNNIRFELCKNSFNAVWKKAAQGSPLSPTLYNSTRNFLSKNLTWHGWHFRRVEFYVIASSAHFSHFQLRDRPPGCVRKWIYRWKNNESDVWSMLVYSKLHKKLIIYNQILLYIHWSADCWDCLVECPKNRTRSFTSQMVNKQGRI